MALHKLGHRGFVRDSHLIDKDDAGSCTTGAECCVAAFVSYGHEASSDRRLLAGIRAAAHVGHRVFAASQLQIFVGDLLNLQLAG